MGDSSLGRSYRHTLKICRIGHRLGFYRFDSRVDTEPAGAGRLSALGITDTAPAGRLGRHWPGRVASGQNKARSDVGASGIVESTMSPLCKNGMKFVRTKESSLGNNRVIYKGGFETYSRYGKGIAIIYQRINLSQDNISCPFFIIPLKKYCII